MRYTMALVLAALSGGAALSHELLWTRRLIDLLGASTESSTLVFECFFLGLALGSACSTPWARRTRHPWRAVALIETGIALLSLPALTLPSWTGWIWPWLGPDRLVSGIGPAVKLTISVLVMIPPTFLMGMTLPLMARAVLAGDRTLGRQGVWLYAANTLGGVVGLLWTTTLMLPWLNVAGSMAVTAALNLLIAGLCVWADRDSAALSPPLNAKCDSESVPRGLSVAVLWMAFASGAGVLGIEVLSMHLFMQVAPSAIHAVAAVLAAIILLLAVSAFVVPSLAQRYQPARELLVPVLTMAGLATASTPLLFMWLTHGMVTIRPSATLWGFVVKMTGYVLATIGPSILMAGLVLPLVFVWFASESGDRHARRWGWLLAVNGIGGIVGAEISQRLIMPLVGMHGGLGVFGLGYAAMAVGMALVNNGHRALRGPVWRPVMAMTIILVLGFGWLLRLPLIHPQPTKKITFETLAMSAGPEGVVAVTDSDELGRGIVMFNQYVLGSTAGLADEQRQAHLPLVLHPAPRHVAFIGLATGITAGAALAHDQVTSVTAIELSQLVSQACKNHFGPFNGGIFTDPRAQVVVEDGRTYIASCEDRFDVVVGDLFLPWRPGVGRLYSLEHFRAVRRALRSGGLYCQMLPMYQFNQAQTDAVIATLLRVFPKIHLFRHGFQAQMPVLTLAAFRDGTLDWQTVGQQCDRLRHRNVVRDPLVRHREGIAMLYMGTIESGPTADDKPINTLGNAWIELHAGLDFVTGKWKDDYFMNAERWLAFERQMAHRHQPIPPGAFRPHRFSQLGHEISRWESASGDNKPIAQALRHQIDAALPEAFKLDRHLDVSVWEGWKVLLRPTPTAR